MINSLMLTDLYLEGFTVIEAIDWMSTATQHKGKLSQDLGLEKGQRLSDLSPDTVVAYAKQSPENKKRVILARTFYFSNPKRKHTIKDRRFWDSVSKKLEKP